MTEELIERKAHVEEKIKALLSRLSEDEREIYSLIENDALMEASDELQEIERLEGFHDYIVLCEHQGVKMSDLPAPTIDDFIEFYENNPHVLLSFGTGKHREPLPHEENEVEDIVDDLPEEDLTELDNESLEVEEVHRAFNEGMPVYEGDNEGEESNGSDESPEVVIEVIENSDSDETLNDQGWEKIEDTNETLSDDEVSDAMRSNPETIVVGELRDAQVKEKRSIFNQRDGDEVEEVSSNSKSNSDEDEATEDGRTPGRLDTQAVHDKDFTEKRGGYKIDSVDEFLDEVKLFLNEEHSLEEYEKFIEHVKEVEFKSTVFTPGYDKIEVNGFIEAILGELLNRSAKK